MIELAIMLNVFFWFIHPMNDFAMSSKDSIIKIIGADED